MAQTILLKRRTSDASAPSASDLTTGEVAVNAYSGKLYIKKTDGTVTEVSGSGGGGSSFPAVYNTYKYTATNGQTTFVGNDSSSNLLTYNVGNLIVFLNGVLLVPTTDYVATTGNTVVLQDGATTNDILTIVAFTATIGDGNVAVDTFSGDGSTTAFTLAANPQNENNTQVFIDGIYQSKSNYSVSGTTLTFSTAPPNNTSIEVTTGSREVTQYTATTLSLPNAGMSITGGDLDIPSDSRKIKLGASNDLQIFHDGTNNYIQGGTGDLRIDAKSGERGIVVTPDGATTLYYDNAAKIATASGGVTITGTATATTFVGALTGNASTATALATARTIGGTSFDGTANIAVNLAATATALANARTIGGTSFDGTANIVPANAVSVTGAAQTNITSVGTLTGLDIGSNSHTGANPAFGITVDGANDYIAQFANTDATAGENHGVRILAGSNANDIAFQIKNKDNNTHFMHITGAGNVGIGTNSPDYQLDIENSSHAVARLHAGTNSSASLRLKNDAHDWDVNIQTNDKFAIYSQTDSTERLVILPTTGYVGINQASPAAALDIKGDTTTYAGMAKIYLTDSNSNSESRNWSIGNGGSGFGHFTIGLSNAKDGDPQASGTHTNPLVIDHTGKISINPVGVAADAPLQHFQVMHHSGGGRRSTLYYNQDSKVALASLNSSSTWENLAIEGANIALKTGGTTNTEAMSIDSNGHTRFGSSGDGFDSAWGHSSYGNTEVAIDGGGGYGVLHIRGDGAGSTNTRFSMGVGDDKFYMAYDDVDGRHNITVDGAGHVSFAKNLVMAAGQGLDFSANSDGSRSVITNGNLFHDYEEGTWTPTIHTGGLSAGSVQLATYTKVGDRVHLQTYFAATGTGDSNDLVIRGLPFTVKNNSYSTSAMDFEKGPVGSYVRTQGGTEEVIALYGQGVSTGRKVVDGNQVGAGYIIFAVTYQTAQ